MSWAYNFLISLQLHQSFVRSLFHMIHNLDMGLLELFLQNRIGIRSMEIEYVTWFSLIRFYLSCLNFYKFLQQFQKEYHDLLNIEICCNIYLPEICDLDLLFVVDDQDFLVDMLYYTVTFSFYQSTLRRVFLLHFQSIYSHGFALEQENELILVYQMSWTLLQFPFHIFSRPCA